jgi:hypothetical protein
VRSIEQRQAQAGGRLNEQAPVRPVGPARPAPSVNQNARSQPNQDGFRSFGQPNTANNAEENNRAKPMLRPQPRVYEQQGTPMEQGRNSASQENRNAQPQPNRPAQPDNRQFRPPDNREPAESHPLVRPAPPVRQPTPEQEHQQEQKFNQWHEQRSSAPPQSRPQPQRSEPKQEKPKK